MTNFTMLVRNRPRLTKQAFDSLGAHEGVTVTVRNDRSNEETHSIIANWFWANEESRWLSCVDPRAPIGTGEARNDVIRTSERKWGRGDYLYLSDNDVFFTPGWLYSLVGAYEFAWDKGYRVLGAYNHPFHQPTAFDPIPNAKWPQSNVMQVHALATQSMLMRWEVWDKYGPFCQTPIDKVCQSEDVDFCNRITKDGFKVGVVSPHLVYGTGITNTFGEKIPGWELVKAQCPEGIICE